MRLVTADDICVAIEDVLTSHLYTTVTAAGWDEDSGGDLEPITKWDQVPTREALSAADLPAGRIESPGLATPPTQSETGWTATWRVIVGIAVRGETHDETASRTRRWAAAVRATVLNHDTLAGLAQSVTWVSEVYADEPEPSKARTLGGCSVSFDVTVADVVELPITQPGHTVPVVETTHTAVTAVTIT